MTIKSKIQQLCKERGITVNTFELESGVGVSQSTKWDKSVPSIDKVIMTADYFGVSVDYLIGKTDVKTPAATGDDELSEARREINDLFSRLTEDEQAAFVTLLKAVAQGRQAPGSRQESD